MIIDGKVEGAFNGFSELAINVSSMAVFLLK